MSTNAIIAEHRTSRVARFDGRVAWVVDCRALRRTIDGSRHLLRCPPGIAFDATEYERLRGEFDRIEVKDRESGIIFRITASEFDARRELLDRGYGRQYYVRLEHWQTTQGGYQPPLPLAMAIP
jgi:hypothetical protein